MVYIPKRIIEDLDAIDIYNVAEKLNINISRNLALCFIHQDHHPSLHFKKSNNSWRCYVCGIGGHSIELVKQRFNCSFQEACIWLSQNFNIPIPNANVIRHSYKYKTLQHTTQQTVNPTIQIDEEILNWIVENARLSELAKHFLFDERGYSEEVISSLKIGSISDQTKFVSAITKVFPKERCLKAGVLIEKNGLVYPVFRIPCLLFPYYDIERHICNIQSRFLGKLEKGDKRRFNNCKGLVPTMFNMPILKSAERHDKIYIAEGVTDCFAFLSEGKKSIALPGAGSFRPEFANYLRNKTLFIYIDNDKAGNDLFDKMNKSLKK